MKKPIVNNDIPDNAGESGSNVTVRNPDGTFKPGHTGNPAGRPKVETLTGLIREALQEIDPQSGEQYKKLLVKRILVKMIQDGSESIINHGWDHLDGKAIQKIDHSTGGEPIQGFTYVMPEKPVDTKKKKKAKE